MEIHDLEYEADGAVMVGRLALPEGDGLLPSVLIAHGAPGMDQFARSRPEAFLRERDTLQWPWIITAAAGS